MYELAHRVLLFFLGYALRNYVIVTQLVRSPIECGHACLRVPACRSFNLAQHSLRASICELNLETKLSRPTDFKKREYFDYYEVVKDKKKVRTFAFEPTGVKDKSFTRQAVHAWSRCLSLVSVVLSG